MAYWGCGIFVLVLSGSLNLTRGEVEFEVQGLLDDKNSEYDDGSPLDIEISVGSPITPNISQNKSVHQTVERAIARAKSQSNLRKTQRRQLNIKRVKV